MKSTVILYAAELSEFSFEQVFSGKSSLELVLEWASSLSENQGICVFASEENEKLLKKSVAPYGSKIEVLSKKFWTRGDFASSVAQVLSQNKSDFAVISYADTPFLNNSLTAELIETHTKYQAEYTFADGYPYGVSPEVIDKGAASILSSLSSSSQQTVAQKPMSRDALFSIMSGDINSFEIETVIADKDYRLLRFEFETSSKINYLACKNLYEKAGCQNPSQVNLLELCDKAALVSVLKTVPAFYNVQIASKYNHQLCYEPVNHLSSASNMNLEDFKKLVSEIHDFSHKAVISLSCFGEPLLHPQFVDFAKEVLKYEGLSLLVETDGTLLSEEIVSGLSQSGKNRIDWIVLVDAMDKNLYSSIHGCNGEDFEKALNSVALLQKYFEGHVYPQFVRMKCNENQLENFYRFWKEPASPSKGQFIVQKYNNFAGLLSDEKPADLSPLERNPCWHLRRDMVILSDGTVPKCLQCFHKESCRLGNVFADGIEACWKKNDEELSMQINKNYSDCCGICDEHYTFNF